MSHHFFLVVFLSALLFFLAANGEMDPSCVYEAKPPGLGGEPIPTVDLCKYELFIGTGNPGTNSKIGIAFGMSLGMKPFGPFVVPDLTKCGADWEQAGVVYFQGGQKNGFVLQGPCDFLGECPMGECTAPTLSGGCKANLTSDGSGSDWFVVYVRLQISSLDGAQMSKGGNTIQKLLSKNNGTLSVPVDLCANNAPTNGNAVGGIF